MDSHLNHLWFAKLSLVIYSHLLVLLNVLLSAIHPTQFLARGSSPVIVVPV